MIRVALAAGVVAVGTSLLLAGPASAASTAPSAVPSATAPNTVVTPTPAPSPAFTSEVPEPVGGITVPAGNALSTRHHGASVTDIAALLTAGVALAGSGTVLVVRRRS